MDDIEMSELISSWSIRPPPQAQPQPYHPQTKVSNRRFTRAEWEDQKSKIQSLYIEEGNTLSQVQETLSQSGFNATLKQLKTKIKSWRLDKKNIKTDDMISIAQTREKRRRVGKDSRFRVYGAPFDEAKIDRFLKRNNLSAEDSLDVPSPTDAPSPVFSVFTPQPASPIPSAVSPQLSNNYPLLPRKGKGQATEEAGVSAEEITGTELIRSPKRSRHGKNALSTSDNEDHQQSFYHFGEQHLSSFISQSNFLSLTTPSLTTYKPGGCIFDTQEGQYFQLFRTGAASELSGFFDSEFWSRSILQQSHSEASIRHAVVALGALYKILEETMLSTPGSSSECHCIHVTVPAHYEFALQQYGKAIRLLREVISTRGVGSFRTTLTSIILFTCFASFTGDQKGTITQIQAGLNLLEECRQRTKQFIALSRDEFIEDELLETFNRLAVQAKYYDMAFHLAFPFVIRLTSNRDDDQGISSQLSAILYYLWPLRLKATSLPSPRK